MDMNAHFDGLMVSRQQVNEWELKRAKRALGQIKKFLGAEKMSGILSSIGVRNDDTNNLEDCRRMLAILKSEMGHDGIREMMGSKTERSTRGVKAILALSLGRRKLTTIDVVAEGIGGQEFLDWFMRSHEANNEAAMLAANPDHWLIWRGKDGRQEVIETVGNAPLPSHIFIDFNDEARPELEPDASFPAQMVAVARLADGRIIGKVRHQFRDEDNGMRARLGIEFPRAFPLPIRRAHRWHLACEFMNWIEAAKRDAAESASTR